MSSAIGFTGLQTHDSLAEVCKLAWHTFYGMQKASEDFENLRFDVWTVAISLDSLHSVGSTSLLIERQPDTKRWALTFSKILNSLNAALRPLYNLVKVYLSTSARERAPVKQWLTNQDINYDGVTVQDFRRKLSLLVESLNVFLSSLTHAELARAKAATETEEYRVLSEVTRTVLQKWDQGRGILSSPTPETATQAIKSPPLNSSTWKDTKLSPLNSAFSSSVSEGQPSPLWPSHQLPPHQVGSNRTSETLNLDGIETGFRRHMHAMRRIREQLRHQKENNHQLTNQESAHFPEPGNTSPTNSHPTMKSESTQTSESPSEPSDTSSNVGTGSVQSSSEAGSVPSTRDADVPRSPSVPGSAKKHRRNMSAEIGGRKRGRSHDEYSQQLGRLNDPNMDGSVATERKPRKTALEQMLTAALFFDS